MNSRLQCTDLSKDYGNVLALDRLSLTLESGRIVGLLGPNGSGKTTLLKLANGLLQPTNGEILLDGLTPGPETKAFVSYLPDANYLPAWMNVRSLVQMFSDFYGDFDTVKAQNMLEQLGIAESARLKTLSKGNKEKVQLILAMSRRAKIYFLDEPIGGVDPAARDYILNTIIQNYSEDALVLISTHLIADIERVLDEAVFIDRGHLVFHRSVDDIREKEHKSVDELFREVFRC
ncbi:MAG: ABC transporter ATP-binding protein [Lachnospiraceae bacterium]|nr:ABC transporter ATP-binding protein [Lachnospiraceae bacterium]